MRVAAQRLGWVAEFRAVARACSIFRRNSIWNMALYVQPKYDLPPVGEPHKLFLNKKVWRGPKHVHTRADPFLYVHQGELFLLNEAMAANGPGWIEGYKTQDLTTFTSLGAILREPGHLSYPMVFGIGSDIFMIPESVYAQEVRLYRFEEFPKRPRKVRSLLIGDYVDTSPVKVDEIWFIFTTSLAGGLELFFTDDIINGVLTPHQKVRSRRILASDVAAESRSFSMANFIAWHKTVPIPMAAISR